MSRLWYDVTRLDVLNPNRVKKFSIGCWTRPQKQVWNVFPLTVYWLVESKWKCIGRHRLKGTRLMVVFIPLWFGEKTPYPSFYLRAVSNTFLNHLSAFIYRHKDRQVVDCQRWRESHWRYGKSHGMWLIQWYTQLKFPSFAICQRELNI